MTVEWGGGCVTCGIDLIKFCFTLFHKLETVDACGLGTYFQRYTSSVIHIAFNLSDDVRKINMNILKTFIDGDLPY